MAENPEGGAAQYRVRLRLRDRELEVSAPDAAWVEQQLHLLIAEAESASPGGNDVPVGITGGNDEQPVSAAKMPSLAEHLQRVGPKGGLEHVIAAGYYLERHTQVLGGFRRRDVADALRAVGYRHSNPGVPIGVARRRGLLMDGLEHEKLQLTESAERWVEERLLRAGLPAEPQDTGAD